MKRKVLCWCTESGVQKSKEREMKMTTRKDIEQVLWNACDSFRGKIDSSRYKDYILSMLFVKVPQRCFQRETRRVYQTV